MAQYRLAILLFDDAEVLDFCGPFEVFSVAKEARDTPAFDVYTVAESTPILARNGLSINPDHTLSSCPAPDILLIPGGVGTRRLIQNESLVHWIGATASDAQLVLSVCTGALLLAKAGLLNGLQVTTHHDAFDLLRALEPSSTVLEGRRFVDNGRIITSAGIAAGIDMSLHVVARLLGAKVARATAKHMEYPWNVDRT